MRRLKIGVRREISFPAILDATGADGLFSR
jgi:hypothetical protein